LNEGYPITQLLARLGPQGPRFANSIVTSVKVET